MNDVDWYSICPFIVVGWSKQITVKTFSFSTMSAAIFIAYRFLLLTSTCSLLPQYIFKQHFFFLSQTFTRLHKKKKNLQIRECVFKKNEVVGRDEWERSK